LVSIVSPCAIAPPIANVLCSGVDGERDLERGQLDEGVEGLDVGLAGLPHLLTTPAETVQLLRCTMSNATMQPQA
jgi:hypothetical protein